MDESGVATSTHFFSSHTEVRRHRVTFQLADGEARELSVVGGLKADCPSFSTRGAVWDLLTVLAHSDWCWVCAGQAAHHLENGHVSSEESNAVVLANTRKRSKIVSGSKLGASSATHDASPADTRVCAIGRVELFVLGNGAGRTQQHGRRDANGELPTRICVGGAVKVA